MPDPIISEAGRLLGQIKSPKKAQASRKNGLKGGANKKPETLIVPPEIKIP